LKAIQDTAILQSEAFSLNVARLLADDRRVPSSIFESLSGN
jgi:hypothetical protein